MCAGVPWLLDPLPASAQGAHNGEGQADADQSEEHGDREEGDEGDSDIDELTAALRSLGALKG